MKKFKHIIATIGAIALFGSCHVNDPIIFDSSFVQILSDDGSMSSSINWESNALLKTYYVTYVSPDSEAVNVTYSITVGQGLTEGVDFNLVQGDYDGTLSFANGIYQRNLRIEWLKAAIDSDLDNSVTIEITGCDKSGVYLGRPGPASYGKTHVITKK